MSTGEGRMKTAQSSMPSVVPGWRQGPRQGPRQLGQMLDKSRASTSSTLSTLRKSENTSSYGSPCKNYCKDCGVCLRWSEKSVENCGQEWQRSKYEVREQSPIEDLSSHSSHVWFYFLTGLYRKWDALVSKKGNHGEDTWNSHSNRQSEAWVSHSNLS